MHRRDALRAGLTAVAAAITARLPFPVASTPDDGSPIPTRLASEPTSSHYHPAWSPRAKILFNGEELRDCFEADRVHGWASVWEDIDERRAKVLHGRVEIVIT